MRFISVVGNADSIFSNRYGYIIDCSDIVVRFNKGRILVPRSQGVFTDILCSAHKSSGKTLKYLNHFNRINGNYDKIQTILLGDMKERKTLYNKFKRKPSVGVTMLEYIKNNYPDYHVRIFGFDWKESQTFYTKEKMTLDEEKLCSHDYEKEKKYCMKLIKRYGWEIY